MAHGGYNFRGHKIVINGVEQTILPGPLPLSPQNGWFAVDESDGLFKVYNESKVKWIPLDDFFETPKGSLDTYEFFELSTARNEWLEYGGSSINSDETPALIPFDCKLIACTFSNENSNVDSDIEVFRSTEGSGGSTSRIATFQVRNQRMARFSNFSSITINAGDKLGVYMRGQGGNPSNVVVKLYLLITNYNKENSEENYSSDFSLSIGGITITIG